MRRSGKFLLGSVTAMLLVASCGSPPKDVVVGVDSGTVVDDRDLKPDVPLPLAASDFAGWDGRDSEVGVFAPCGTALSELFEAPQEVRAEAMESPTGVSVISQVSDYASASEASALPQVVADEVISCPLYEDADGNEVLVRTINETVGGVTITGAERTVIDKNTGNRTVEVYLIVHRGSHVSEVFISADVGPDGTGDLVDFGIDLIVAGDGKTEGKDVPKIPSPTFPEPVKPGQSPDDEEDDSAQWYDPPTQPEAPDYGLETNPDLIGGEGGSGTSEVFDPDEVGVDDIDGDYVDD